MSCLSAVDHVGGEFVAEPRYDVGFVHWCDDVRRQRKRFHCVGCDEACDLRIVGLSGVKVGERLVLLIESSSYLLVLL